MVLFLLFQVDNYLPSVSAAIGDLPQRHVWRFVIFLHTFPRVQFAFVYYSYFSNIIVKWATNLILVNCILNLIEILSLFGLTFVASTDNYSKFLNNTCFVENVNLLISKHYFGSTSQDLFYYIPSYFHLIHGSFHLSPRMEPYHHSKHPGRAILSL